MSIYEEKISDNSIWITATPSLTAMSLPFYATEAGHFHAQNGYTISREMHDSFLMLYTLNGNGVVCTGDTQIILAKNNAVIIDCRHPHKYYCLDDSWEFLWLHFKGNGINPLFNILCQDTVHPIEIKYHHDFEQLFTEIIHKINKNNIAGSVELSADIHSILSQMIKFNLNFENGAQKKEHTDDVNKAVTFIKNNYPLPISVDDMISDIHISKYHFIRIFRRVMGVTPYNYLTNHRINTSKTLLRTTDKSISEIALMCGFLDTSNFIAQFKKQTGQKPLEYRRDFS